MISVDIKNCQARLIALEKVVPVKEHSNRIAEIDELMVRAGFWNNQQQAAVLTKERQSLITLLERFKALREQFALLNEYVETFPEDPSINDQMCMFEKELIAFELKQVLDGEHDNAPAILTITAGAGGSEAKNWTQMLARVYMRYADRAGWKVEILDQKSSEEHSAICLDNISLQFSGEYAYGYLKHETGVHRLIRCSPFNSGNARHTSFAAVSVMPDIEDKIEIEINPNDIEWEVMRSSGSGGQSVNTTDSACRIRHKPTGISIRAQTEKSQHENKRIALKLLKNKLYDIEVQKRNAEKDKQLEQQSATAFGSQIRTATLTPYTLVKDHRSKYETNNADDYLDGNIYDLLATNLVGLR